MDESWIPDQVMFNDEEEMESEGEDGESEESEEEEFDLPEPINF